MRKIIIFAIAMFLYTNTSFAIPNDIISHDKITDIQAKYGGKIGVYSIDRNNMGNFYYQQFFSVPICSVYKFLVVGAVLKKDMNEKGFLNRQILITKDDTTNVGYSPITSKNIGKKLSIYQLSQAAIQSDNAASNILVNQIGGLDSLNKFITLLGDKKTTITNTEPSINVVNLKNENNKTTAKSITRDLNTLAFKNTVLDKAHRIIFKKMLKMNKTGKIELLHNYQKIGK